jgi:hypothetical protein
MRNPQFRVMCDCRGSRMIRHAQRREVEHAGRAAAGGRATTNIVEVLNPTVREPRQSDS